MVRASTISPGYFNAFKIPLLRGRIFTDRDDIGSSSVVVINAAMARRFWREVTLSAMSVQPFLIIDTLQEFANTGVSFVEVTIFVVVHLFRL